MIDTETLEELLRDAANEIAVPAGGPARVLAARDELARGQDRDRGWRVPGIPVRLPRPRPKPVLAGLAGLAAVGLLVGVVVASAGGSGSPKAASSALHSTSGPGFGPNGSFAGLPAVGSGGSSGGSTGGGNSGSAGVAGPPVTSAGPAAGSSSVPSVAPKVIQTGSVSLVVGSGRVNATMNQLTSDATALGGFVASTDTQSGSGPATGDITLRVPVANFDALLNEVRGIGRVTSVTTSGQDVTSQYADLGAQLQSLEDTRTQFEQIMTQATTIGAILSVEQQISALQTQIQELQGQLQVMDNQTAYGTLAVHVTEATKAEVVAPPPGPPSGLTKAWDHARHTFARGLESVVAALGGIAVFLVCVLILALVGRLGWGVVRRRLV